MSEYLIQGATLTAIADAIREKEGTTDAIPAADMAARIEAIESGGGDMDVMITGVGLTEISSDTATSVREYAFRGCYALVTVDLPQVKEINMAAFSYCAALEIVDFPQVTRIKAQAFSNCSALSACILRNETAVTLDNTNVFTNTPIASGTGYIYVPSALLDTYEAATNWSTYAEQIRALEEYTVDGTVTGELDESKI